MVVVFSDGLFPEWGRLKSAGAVFPFGGLAIWPFGRVRLFAWAGSDGRERINMPSDCQLLPFVVKMGYERL